MEEFCKTLDIRYINNLPKQTQEHIKKVIVYIDPYLVPIKTRSQYYSLYTFFFPEPPRKILKIDICNFLALIPLTMDKINRLFFTCYNRIVLKNLGPNIEELNPVTLRSLFDIIDELYFGGEIMNYIKSTKSTLTLNVISDEEGNEHKIAGVCGRDRKCDYYITINKDIFDYSFSKYTMSRSGGLKCYNKLECMLITFQHEIVHLLIFLFCNDKDTPSDNYHGTMFKKICFSVFGQTDFTHKLNHDPDIGVTKEQIKDYKYVFFASGKDKKEIGRLVDFYDKDVGVVTSKDIFLIPYQQIYESVPDLSKIPKEDILLMEKKGVTREEAKNMKYVSVTYSNGLTKIGRIINLLDNNAQVQFESYGITGLHIHRENIPYVFINRKEPTQAEIDKALK